MGLGPKIPPPPRADGVPNAGPAGAGWANNGGPAEPCAPEANVLAGGVPGLLGGGVLALGAANEANGTGFGLGELDGGVPNPYRAGEGPTVDGGRVNGLGFGAAVGVPKREPSGGVLTLDVGSVFSSPFTRDGDLAAEGCEAGEAALGASAGAGGFAGSVGSFSVVSSSLSAPLMGALARGELLVGFVDGLPRPAANTPGDAALTGTGAATGEDLSSGEHDVVEDWSFGKDSLACGGDESVKWMVGVV